MPHPTVSLGMYPPVRKACRSCCLLVAVAGALQLTLYASRTAEVFHGTLRPQLQSVVRSDFRNGPRRSEDVQTIGQEAAQRARGQNDKTTQQRTLEDSSYFLISPSQI